MFRAKIKDTGQDIVILDSVWDGEIESLRKLGQQGGLVCPGCQEPVRVRVYRRRRRHFAHKHLRNCPYGGVSPALLHARAVLYQFLVGKFPDQVQVEKPLQTLALPRPVDFWVDHENGPFAYWIIGNRMPPQERETLQAAFDTLQVKIHWLFLDSLLREDAGSQILSFKETTELANPAELSDPAGSTGIHLTTTERAFMRRSVYDEIDVRGEVGCSLHFLHAVSAEITTFRNLHLVHEPQLYQGRKVRTNFTELQISLAAGEFVHPGEANRVEAVRAAKAQAVIEAERKDRELTARIQAFFQGIPPPAPSSDPVDEDKPVPGHTGAFDEPAVCVFCGAVTTDYWFLNRVDGTCKCKACYRLGRA